MITAKERSELTRAYVTEGDSPSNVIATCAACLLILGAVAAGAEEVAGVGPMPSPIKEAAAERVIAHPADADDQYAGFVFYELQRKGTLMRAGSATKPPRLRTVGFEGANKKQ